MTTAIAVILDISVITALALLICRLLESHPAARRHMVLASALAAAAAVPLLEAALPRWEIALLPATSQAASSALTLSEGAPAAGGIVGVSHVAAPPLVTWSELLLVIWALGFLVVMTGLLAGLARLFAMTRRCRPVQSIAWRELASSLVAQFNLRPVAILESRDQTPLLTWGLFRPRIIVPAGAAVWTSGRIEAVLAHELAHIARRDWTLQIAAQIVCAVYWFNPLVWMTCRRLRNESEQACDDAVLRRGIDPADYATHLLAVARQVRAGGHRWASAPAIVNSSSLERRIAAMLKPSCSREALTGTAALLALLAAFVAAAPVTALTLIRQIESMPVVTPAGRDVVLSAPAPASALALEIAAQVPPKERRPVADREAPRPVIAMPAAAPAAAAQAPASLSGVLRDASGAVLPGVEVTLTNTAVGMSYMAVSDASGQFLFRSIPAARYELSARLPGFRAVADKVILSGGDEQKLSLVMQVGSLMETVAVTCAGGAAALPRSAGAAFLALDRRGMAPPLFALPQAGQSLPVRVGGQIAAPRQISRVAPTCPGTPPGGGYVVILEATIGDDGLVRDIVSLRPKPADAQTAPFMQAAMDAVRQWQYTPTRLNNVPTPVIMTVTVTFSSK
jgi:beta-lactamase regulating signal transducer with metallopeptidase domain